jgi:hypothetical protein
VPAIAHNLAGSVGLPEITAEYGRRFHQHLTDCAGLNVFLCGIDHTDLHQWHSDAARSEPSRPCSIVILWPLRGDALGARLRLRGQRRADAREPPDWERDLLARYLERLGEHTGQRLDFGQSFTWYRQQLLHALAVWTITPRHSPLLPSVQSEPMTFAMIERMAVAIDNLNALDSV